MVKTKGLEEENLMELWADDEEAEEVADADGEAVAGEEEVAGILILAKGIEQAPDISVLSEISVSDCWGTEMESELGNWSQRLIACGFLEEMD